MPPRGNERANLRAKNKTTRKAEFAKMRRWFPDRLNIVAEGDSWFAYPPKWLFGGKPSNLVAHLSRWTKGKANFYSMAWSGDEAVDMVSGAQKHKLVDILRWHTRASNRKPVDLLLFSGGGNDIVGENDFERFLRPYKSNYTAKQCLNMVRLKRKTKQIGLAYQELADIRDHYSPSTVIMTHTYDYPYPSNTGAKFLGGLIYKPAWMKRFMDDPKVAIPERLQADVIKTLMDQMAHETLAVGAQRNDFIVVGTLGTLTGKTEWLNEIHPKSEGFGRIAKKMFEQMTARFPQLKPTSLASSPARRVRRRRSTGPRRG